MQCVRSQWDHETIARHNDEIAKVWEDFDAGRPERVPIVWNFNRRFHLLTPWLNDQGYSFRDYFEDPAVQWSVQLSLQKWVR